MNKIDIQDKKNIERKDNFNIGVDLDDVVFEFVGTLINNYEKKHGRRINYEDVFSYHFSRVFNHTDERMNEIISKIFDYKKIRDMDLCDSAYDSLKQISKNNNIYFITSRFNNIDATLESIEKNFRNFYSDIIFSSNPYVGTPGKSKGEICEDYNIDFMIEDSKEHAINCAKKGVRTFLLDKPWNRNYESHKNLIKVNDWNEILEKLNKKICLNLDNEENRNLK